VPPGLGTGLRATVSQAVPGRAFAAVIRAVYPRLEPELACLATWAPRGGTAVDVGAWYGPWTVRLAGLADRVVSIEPNPGLAAAVRTGCPAAWVVEAAASDHDGAAELYLPPGGRGAEGTASLEHAGYPEHAGRSITVRRVTIDGLGLTGVRFIKMDIEGHEAAALRGAEQTIKRDSPVLVLELETRHQRIDDVIGTLAGWGYRGTVLAGRSWVPLSAFDLAAHQRANSRVAARGMLGRLARPRERYVNLVRFERG
jgi:FkbM family methyltransferase